MDRLNNGGKDVLPQRRGGGGGGLKKILAFLMITGVVIISCQNLKVSNLVLQVQVGISSDFNAPVIVSSSSNQQSIISLSTSDNNSYHDIPNIEELVKFNTTTTTTCPPGLTLIQNTHLPTSVVVHPTGRKIPKIIHITSRYRCATPAVIQNVDKWRFQNYSVYFHDDQAMDTLFTHPYTRNQFPTLREGLKCATNGATKADLWRYLVLYMYGGIYTDIDNSPTGFNGETIQAKDDSFFAVESLGILSQFFLASSFGHPLMAKMLEVGVQQLKGTRNVMKNFPAQNTGPGKYMYLMYIVSFFDWTNKYYREGFVLFLFCISYKLFSFFSLT